MNSLTELNAWGNTAVSFANAADYEIVINNSGNASITQDEEELFTPPKRITVSTLSNAPKDVLVTFSVSSAESVADIVYVGNFSNIGLAQLGTATWQFQGIRTAERYNEAFANLRCQLATDQTTVFDIVTTVDDGQGTTASAAVTVTVTDLPEFAAPTSIDWTEGLTADIVGIEILDNAVGNPEYTVTLVVNNSDHGLLGLDGTAAAAVVRTGTRGQLNTIFANSPPRWEPQGDFAFTDSVLLSIVRNSDGVVLANNQSITMNITATHDEFAVPASVVFDEDLPVTITGISILDQRFDDPTYTITIAATDDTASEILFDSVAANSVTQVGTKTQLNGLLANSFAFVPAADLDQDTTITYTQIRNSDGAVHANAVPIAMLIGSTHNEFTVPGVATVIGGQTFELTGFGITDLALDKNYTVTVTSVPTELTFERDNDTVSNYQVTGNLSAVNAEINGNWTFNASRYYYGGNSTVSYTQLQTTDNITQGNNFPITIQVIEDPLFYFTSTDFNNNGTMPQYVNIDPDQNSYLYNCTLRVVNQQATTARLIFNGGAPQTQLNFSGTATQIKSAIDLVTVSNFTDTAVNQGFGNPSDGKYIEFTQINAVTGITEGHQDFWHRVLAPGDQFSFGGVVIFENFWCAASPFDAGFPRRSVMRLYGNLSDTYSVTLHNTLNTSPFAPISSPDNFRFYPVRNNNNDNWFTSNTGSFVDGDTWIECADAVITLTGAELNNQMHWNNFQVRPGEFRRILVHNVTTNTAVASGVFQVSAVPTAASHDRVIVQLDRQS